MRQKHSFTSAVESHSQNSLAYAENPVNFQKNKQTMICNEKSGKVNHKKFTHFGPSVAANR